MTRSDDRALDLLLALDVNVPPESHAYDTKNKHAGSGNIHVSASFAIGLLNRDSNGAADGVAGLNLQVTVNRRKLADRGLGEVLHERLGEGLLPDSGCDCHSDGAADAGEHALDGEDDGNVLVHGGGHDGHLLGDDEGAAAKGDEDLTHDDVADIDVRLAELDHETRAEHGDRHAKVEGDPLVAPRPADGEADGDGEEARADAVDLGYVAGFRDGQTIDNLEERAKVRVPDVEAHKEGGGEHARANDGAVQEEVVGDEGDGREPLLPDAKGDEQEDAEDNEADDNGRLPEFRLHGLDVESEQEQRQTADDEEKTDDVKFAAVVEAGLRESPVAGAVGEDTALLGHAQVVDEEHPDRHGDDGDDKGEGPETPAESGPIEEGLADRSREPRGDCDLVSSALTIQ